MPKVARRLRSRTPKAEHNRTSRPGNRKSSKAVRTCPSSKRNLRRFSKPCRKAWLPYTNPLPRLAWQRNNLMAAGVLLMKAVNDRHRLQPQRWGRGGDAGGGGGATFPSNTWTALVGDSLTDDGVGSARSTGRTA